jgi:hypothetical protein
LGRLGKNILLEDDEIFIDIKRPLILNFFIYLYKIKTTKLKNNQGCQGKEELIVTFMA